MKQSTRAVTKALKAETAETVLNGEGKNYCCYSYLLYSHCQEYVYTFLLWSWTPGYSHTSHIIILT